MILVDTDVLIAHLRGLDAAEGWLRRARQQGPLAVSAVTVAELTGGMRSGGRRAVWGLLSRLGVEPVTDGVARRAGEFMRVYRRSHQGIGTSDYLIAATADLGGYQLATLNVRHFPMFEDLSPTFRLD
ncbi:MAG: type II toxin-antitoxin system VapC family toxin [Aeromicrobium sp.]|uniref:type II toxin-antitoxin system VapC family toxin n=1 Tax=Aeromicrobium sp. TaxID=1871063 RepID=UPI0039E2E6AE